MKQYDLKKKILLPQKKMHFHKILNKNKKLLLNGLRSNRKIFFIKFPRLPHTKIVGTGVVLRGMFGVFQVVWHFRLSLFSVYGLACYVFISSVGLWALKKKLLIPVTWPTLTILLFKGRILILTNWWFELKTWHLYPKGI